MNKKNFWKGKTVFITGHTGFKGSWLCLWLHSLGAEIVGYSLDPPSDPNLFDVAGVSKCAKSIYGDVRDLDQLKTVMFEFNPDIVIHMAAQSLVRRSYQEPVCTYSTNVMGTVNLLEAVKELNNVKVVLVVTSDKCYENKEWLWGYREIDPMGGYDPYSSSKGCAELVVSAYRRSFFSNLDSARIATVRAGNVIGGGDWGKDRLIPDIIRSFLNKDEVIIRNPDAVRPWQYVLDALNGYMILIEHLWDKGKFFEGGWNFSSSHEDSKNVRWIVDKMVEFWGDGVCWRLDAKAESPHEAGYLKLDSSKAMNLLKWRPCMDLINSLRQVVLWYKMYQRGGDMYKFSKQEISSFEKIYKS